MREEYKTICDTCGRGTWYEIEQRCHMTYPKTKTCKCCGDTKETRPPMMVPCAGMLKVIDRSELAPEFTQYYTSGARVSVLFASGETKRGTIGKTSGWRPVYLLMLTRRSVGSSWTIGAQDKVLKVIEA